MKATVTVVMIFLMSGFLSACDVSSKISDEPPNKFPLRVRIDQTFRDDEREAIARAMDVWNNTTEPYRQDKTLLLVYDGPVDDAFNSGDGSDDTMIAYNVILDREQRYWKEDAVANHPGAIGLNSGDDIAIPTFLFTDEEKQGEDYGQTIEFIALHEFGHLLGIGHLENVAAIMYPYLTVILDENGKPSLTNADIRAFCELYGCKQSHSLIRQKEGVK